MTPLRRSQLVRDLLELLVAAADRVLELLQLDPQLIAEWLADGFVPLLTLP